MSSKLDIIAEGYSDLLNCSADGQPESQHMRATGSCCLIRSGGSNILFDTMGPWEKDRLISRLNSLGVHQDDINYLVCSHSHPDHIGNINLFTRAIKHFIGTSVYSQDTYYLDYFEPTGSYNYRSMRLVDCVVPEYKTVQLDNNITIQPTPGHTMECVSMFAKNCDNLGTVALVGDLFEKEQDVLDESIWLGAGSHNPDLQRAHRSYCYNNSDFIMPGHGPLFKTEFETNNPKKF